MTNYINYSGRESVENLHKKSEQNAVKTSKLFSLLNSFWQHLATTLFNGQEPQIWQSTDSLGNTWWHGYDPITDCSVRRESEEEMRIWLEERYYQ